MEPSNYETVRLCYALAMPFPINYIVPSRMRKTVTSKLAKIGLTQDQVRAEIIVITKQVYKDALRGYQALANRIGSNKFFFGDKYAV